MCPTCGREFAAVCDDCAEMRDLADAEATVALSGGGGGPPIGVAPHDLSAVAWPAPARPRRWGVIAGLIAIALVALAVVIVRALAH